MLRLLTQGSHERGAGLGILLWGRTGCSSKSQGAACVHNCQTQEDNCEGRTRQYHVLFWQEVRCALALLNFGFVWRDMNEPGTKSFKVRFHQERNQNACLKSPESTLYPMCIRKSNSIHNSILIPWLILLHTIRLLHQISNAVFALLNPKPSVQRRYSPRRTNSLSQISIWSSQTKFQIGLTRIISYSIYINRFMHQAQSAGFEY